MGYFPVSSYSNVTVQSSSATKVIASNPTRKGFFVYNNGTVIIYVGMDSSVTTSTGTPVFPNSTFDMENQNSAWRGDVWAIAASSTADCRYWEWTA